MSIKKTKSKPKEIEKVQEYTDDFERLMSPWWILFIAIFVTWGVASLLIPVVAEVSIWIFSYIFKDWYLLTAFVSLVAISIGWSILEGFFKFSLYLRLAHPNLAAYTIKIIQFIVIVLFITLIFFRYITIFDFDSIYLYIISVTITALISALYFRSKRFENRIKKSISLYYNQRNRDDFYKYFYIKIEYVLLIALFSGIVFIFLWLSAYGDVAWIKQFTSMLSDQLLHNPFIAILFSLIITFTFFAPLMQLISELLPVFALDILSYQQKHTIKRVRKWTLFYFLLAVFWRIILPLWNIDLWINIVVSSLMWIGFFALTKFISHIGAKSP